MQIIRTPIARRSSTDGSAPATTERSIATATCSLPVVSRRSSIAAVRKYRPAKSTRSFALIPQSPMRLRSRFRTSASARMWRPRSCFARDTWRLKSRSGTTLPIGSRSTKCLVASSSWMNCRRGRPGSCSESDWPLSLGSISWKQLRARTSTRRRGRRPRGRWPTSGQQLLGIERIGVNDDFLALGGDSMLAALIIARIRDTTGAPVSILAFFERPTIAGLAELIDRGGEERLHASDPIVAGSMRGDLPVSSAQRRMWFIAELEENSTAYNRSNLFRIRGALDLRALERAFHRIAARHAVLRTTFQSRDGDPVQIVGPPAPIAVAHLYLSEMSEGNRLDIALAAAVEASNLKFDLARDPMLRPLLIRLAEDDHLLVLTMHHIASDGWSAGVLMRELSALYESELIGNTAGAEAEVLKPLAVQYVDFARWQSQAARGPAMQESLAWWHDRLEGAPPLLALPGDRPRPPRQTFSGAAESFVIPTELTDRLKELARGERATLFMTLLAAFQTMLRRYTAIDDIVVGTPVAGRTRFETEGLIGLFVNMLAMRGDLAGDPSFRELLGKTRDRAFEAYEHQDLPFDMLVESIHPERNLSYQPIVQVTFQVRNYPLEDTQLAGLAVEEVDFDPGAPFDLSFEVTQK